MKVIYLAQEGDVGAVKIDSADYGDLPRVVAALQAGNPRIVSVRAVLAGSAIHAQALRLVLARHAIVCADGSWFDAAALRYLPADLEPVEHSLVEAA